MFYLCCENVITDCVMSKSFKDYQDKPLHVSEPGATSDVQTSGQHAPLQDSAMSDTMSVEEARKMTLAAMRGEYALQHDMTVEELYDVISDEIDSIYANA